MRLHIDQPPCPRDRRVIRRLLVEPDSQKSPQPERIRRSPSDPALRIDSFKIPNQQQPKIDPRHQRGPPVVCGVKLRALPLGERIELSLFQQFIHSLVERMAWPLRQFIVADPQPLLPLSAPSCPHRHRSFSRLRWHSTRTSDLRKLCSPTNKQKTDFHHRLLGAFLLLLMIGTPVANHTTFAGNTVGSFEIDGNLIVDHSVPPTEPIDWDSSPFPAALTTFTDGTGATDDIFGMGSKENDQSTWICTAGSAPAKDDLVSEISINGAPPIAGEIAFRFFSVSGVQKQFLYANWSRLSNNGDAHIDYEFSQADPSANPASPRCSQLPRRTPGDFLISFDTQNGGAIIGVSAFTWNGTTFVPLAVGSQGILWDAAVNTIPSITGLTATGINLFGELALNVSDTIGEIPCNKVLFVSMKTRASTSLSADLKDRTSVKPVNLTVVNPAA